MSPESRGKIEVTGTDRVSFLHNILTNDIKNLKPGESCPAALLSAPAKVLALMKVRKLEDKIMLETDPDFEEKLPGLLEKLIITEDVRLEILKGADAVPVEAEITRIERGILRYGVDVTEEVSLPETGLDDTYASETKGCYPGQEVVARTKTYKGLQRKMTGLFLPPSGTRNDLPQNGDKIYSGEKEIGWITSACVSPKFGGIALGYAAKGFFEKPCEVEIKTASGLLKAKTCPLPFHRRSG